MASLFTSLKTELASKGYSSRSNQAKKWFAERVRELNGRINRRVLLNDGNLTTRSKPIWGNMFMFAYDPKLKDVLPYYDLFPLVIALQPAPGGFLGLNLHYLRPDVRAAFLDKLIDTMPDGDALTDRSKLRLRYNMISKIRHMRQFAPCLKHYLLDHVKTRMAQVHAPDWETAIFLPTEQFRGSNKTKIWKESQKIYQSR